MALADNVVGALVSGELGLESFAVTQAQAWTSQIRGAYGLLFPYIENDFRGKLDCLKCHNQLSFDYMSHIHVGSHQSDQHQHLPFQSPMDEIAKNLIDKKSYPSAKVGTINVGTYE